MENKNKVVLVTGSSRGMGRAEAIEFARRGYDVIVHYSGNKAKAEEAKSEIEKLGANAAVVQADLRKKEEVEMLAEKAEAAFGKIDVLVNNAGYALYNDFSEKTIETFEEMMKIHLYAPFYLTKLLAPKMAEHKFGRIINIGTIDVMKTYNAESAEYDAAKSALISLTKNSALAYQPYVNVNCVCPGWIQTEMTEQNSLDLNEYIKGRICKKRSGKPEEVAKTVAFLVSEDAEYIDGETICVDGGYKLV